MASFLEESIAVNKSSVDVMETVIKQLRYEINSVESNIVTARRHSSYVTQAMVRQSGHALNGAVSLAVRLSGVYGVSVPLELRAKASEVAKAAKEFKKN